jgi:glycosyltransferase involved in cell wall biosynthesis
MRQLEDDIKLTIVDGGAPRHRFTPKMIRKYGLENRVTFTGKVQDVRELAKFYSASNIAIVPSLYEGFGFPAAEAMSCGLPVIASNTSALPEVVGNGECGILVPPRNPDAIASAVRRLFADEESMLNMGKSGRERVEKLFNWREAAQRTIAVYEEVLSAYR